MFNIVCGTDFRSDLRRRSVWFNGCRRRRRRRRTCSENNYHYTKFIFAS